MFCSLTSKHAGSDPEAFWLRLVMAITASYGHYGQRAARIGLDSIIMPDPTSRVRFSSVFPDKAWVILCKAGPDPIWMAWPGIRSGWPGQGLAKRIWSGSKPVCRNHLARFLAGRNRPATSFPLLDSGFVHPQTSRIILCQTSPDPV